MDNNTQAPIYGVEDFKKFMETEEGRKVLNPMFDKKVSTAIETWKSNNIEKVVNEELVKRGYVKTEEQKKMLELELAELNANGLNTALADFISYDSEETIRTGVSTFKSVLDDLVEKEVKKRTAGTGAKPQDVKNTAPKLTVKDVMKMSYKERNQLAKENPELFKQLMGV